MKGSIHTYFQMGTNQWINLLKKNMWDLLCEIACDDFFDVIEVCEFKEEKTRTETKRILGQSCLKVCYGAQTRILEKKLNLNMIRKNQHAKTEETVLQVVDIASFRGARSVVFLSG